MQGDELSSVNAGGIPQWLRFERDGTTFVASYSSDGANWTDITTVELEEAADSMDVGMAVTSDTEENLRATFEVSNPSIPSGVPSSGLEAYFPLDEGATNGITGTDATVSGSSPDATGIRDGAFSFDAANSGSLVSGEDLPLNGPGATIAAWINYSDHDQYGRVFKVGGGPESKAPPNGGYNVLFYETSDDIYSYMPGATGGSEARPKLTLSGGSNTWYFIVVVMDGDSYQLFAYNQSGQVSDSPVGENGIANRSGSSKPLTLMAGDVSYTTGRMDEVYGYSRALSPSEVDTLYTNSF